MSGVVVVDYYTVRHKHGLQRLVVREGNTTEELTVSGNKDVFKLCLKRDTRHQSD